MSQNPTLINGFEDVMTFIKQQVHRIKELEKENEKLKTKDAFMEQVRKECEIMLETVAVGISKKDMLKLQQENEKLKGEIEEYIQTEKPLDDYQKVLDYMAGHKDCDVYDVHSDWIIEEIKGLKEENKKLEKEKKNLQEENEMLEGQIILLQSSEEGLEKKLDTGGWSPTSSPEPKQ